jgi:hypothetical protein
MSKKAMRVYPFANEEPEVTIFEEMDTSTPINNALRANIAAAALDSFASYTGQADGCEPLDEVFSDLLTNLRHLAVREGLDWEGMLRIAKGHFATETYKEDNDPTNCPGCGGNDSQCDVCGYYESTDEDDQTK